MPLTLFFSNLKFIKTKGINPFCPNQFLNSIFVLLRQSHSAMKQLSKTNSTCKSCHSDSPCGWFFRFERRFRNFRLYGRVFIFSVFITLQSFTGYAQQAEEIDPMPIKLKGQVLNLEDEMPVPNAIIMNMRTKLTISTDLQGRFTMDALNIDSLQITSLGYAKSIAHIPANYNEVNILIIYAKPIRFTIPDVNVRGEQKKVNMEGVPVGKENKIAPELRGDAYDKKPSALAAVFTPASFLQYHLSKSEKEKRETRKAIISEKQWDLISQFYNKKLVQELTGLNNTEADYFMMYINGKGLLSEMRTEYDVRNIIKQQFKLYRDEGH